MRAYGVEVPDQVEALRKLAQLTQRSVAHPLVRTTAIQIVRKCPSRDDTCELEAIYNAVKYGDPDVDALKKGFRYVSDPVLFDSFTAPFRSLELGIRAGAAGGAAGGDCLPGETLLLGAGYKPFQIADAKIGDLVMGDGQWTRITNVWDKGEQAILEFHLRNGGVLRCTPDHRVFVVPKNSSGYAGDCREAIEVRASEVKPGDDLLTPDRLPFGQESLGADRSYLLGLHVAEGWVDYSRADGRALRVGISGKDGWRKEGNKHRINEICERLGAATRWHEKYIAINNEEIASWLASCGRLAKNKHLPSLNFDQATIQEILVGLNADADVRSGIFSTTSQELALQYRLMLRMFGRSTHIKRVDDHGGLGKNPIYRVTPRQEGGSHHPHARVVAIAEGERTQTYDIEVEGHRFYLPETDLVVHNCDDHASLIAALCASIGFASGLRAWGKQKPYYEHVYAIAGLPKRDPRDWFSLDTTVGKAYVGWEPPSGHVLNAVVAGDLKGAIK